MAEDDQAQHRATPAPERQPRSLPQGYRQGIITAITVLLGFSLTFFRFWGFEASGKWTVRSIISTGTLGVAVVLQIIALFRSLRLEDDDEQEYRTTVLWFIAAAVVLLLGLVFAIVEFSGVSEIAPHHRV
jgi:predicted membrane channel-forming protein YqfA (hemolysin III family)